jgi:hypothetical protein
MLDRLSRVWASWKQRWTDARVDACRRDDLAHEIACLEHAGELEGVLSTLGLGAGAVPFLLKRYPGAIRRHAAACHRLRVASPDCSDSAGLGGLNRAQLRCVLCPAAGRCETWLRGNDNGLPAFCPGRSAFERLPRTAPARSDAAAR